VTPPGAEDSGGLPRGAITWLATAAFASALSLRVNDALLPKLASVFAVSVGSASQVIGLFAIAYGVAQLFFGPVGDRFGKYRVIGWAAVACTATALFCAAAPDFAALRIARACAGATAAAMIPLSMAWIGDVVPYERRQPVLARFLIGQILGLCAGVWLGGFAADHTSWRAPYLLVSILFAAVSVGVLRLDRRLPAHARTTRVSGGHPIARLVAEFGGVLALPWARRILLVVFLEGVFLFGPFAFIATHAHQSLGLSMSAAGALAMLFGLGGFGFAVSAARLVARLGEAGLARWGGAFMGFAMFAIAFAPAWGWALGACFLLGLGYYMLHNTLQVNATQMAPDRRGAAVAAFASCFFLGQSAGVSLGGWWVGTIGTARFLVFGAVGVVATAFAFVALRDRHLRDLSNPA
jgi:predicted MFS family arabinose efflux permease